MKKHLKTTTLILSVILMIFTMTGCLDPADDGSDVNTISVTMNILYSDAEDAENVTDFEMQVEESATVLELLKSFADQQDIEVVIDDTSSTVYVTSINEICAGDSSGWIYEINGESAMEEASKYVLEDGDEITWEYIIF